MKLVVFDHLPQDAYLSVDQFASLLNVSPETVRRAVRKGFLAEHIIRRGRGQGGQIFFRTASLRDSAATT